MSPQHAYATMLTDPCNATLKGGLYGSEDGNLQQFTSNFAVDSAFGSLGYGYAIWFPDYHNAGGTGGTGTEADWNVIEWWNASVNQVPAALNFGNALASDATTGHSHPDPVSAFLAAGNTAQDCRTVGACLKANYTNSISNAKGLVYPLANIPLSIFYSNAIPTIGELMTYAGDAFRPLDPVEVKWRPSLGSTTFRNATDYYYYTQQGANLSVYDSAPEVMGIGLVFYNVTSRADFVLEGIKNAEWRPSIFNGLRVPRPVGMSNTNVLSSVLSVVDKVAPNWQTKAAVAGTQLLANTLSKIVLGGSQQRAAARQIEWVNLVN